MRRNEHLNALRTDKIGQIVKLDEIKWKSPKSINKLCRYHWVRINFLESIKWSIDDILDELTLILYTKANTKSIDPVLDIGHPLKQSHLFYWKKITQTNRRVSSIPIVTIGNRSICVYVCYTIYLYLDRCFHCDFFSTCFICLHPFFAWCIYSIWKDSEHTQRRLNKWKRYVRSLKSWFCLFMLPF